MAANSRELHFEGLDSGIQVSTAGSKGAARASTLQLVHGSEIARGAGEATRTRVLNDAFGQDQDFFSFYRSMQAYEATFTSESTFMVLSPDSDFFDFFSAIGRKPRE